MEVTALEGEIEDWRVGWMMKEKESGRRKRTERARKWREWALIIRFDSERTPKKFRVSAGAAMATDSDRDGMYVYRLLPFIFPC